MKEDKRQHAGMAGGIQVSCAAENFLRQVGGNGGRSDLSEDRQQGNQQDLVSHSFNSTKSLSYDYIIRYYNISHNIIESL